MRIPPYDTGKLKIGGHYVAPPNNQPMSRDAERLQQALLDTPQRYTDADREEWRVVVKDALMWIAFIAILFGLMLTPTILNLFFGA
jgi:hypothetical protein